MSAFCGYCELNVFWFLFSMFVTDIQEGCWYLCYSFNQQLWCKVYQFSWCFGGIFGFSYTEQYRVQIGALGILFLFISLYFLLFYLTEIVECFYLRYFLFFLNHRSCCTFSFLIFNFVNLGILTHYLFFRLVC